MLASEDLKHDTEPTWLQTGLSIAHDLWMTRYSGASALILAGSITDVVSCPADIDLLIIYEHIQESYEEGYLHKDWPIDAKVHDPETLAHALVAEMNSPQRTHAFFVSSGLLVADKGANLDILQRLAQIGLAHAPFCGDIPYRLAKAQRVFDKFDKTTSKYTRLLDVARWTQFLAENILLYYGCPIVRGAAVLSALDDANPQLGSIFCSAIEAVLISESSAHLRRLYAKIFGQYVVPLKYNDKLFHGQDRRLNLARVADIIGTNELFKTTDADFAAAIFSTAKLKNE